MAAMLRVEARASLAALAILLLVSSAGCTGQMRRLYPGPPLPPTQVALLKHQTGFGNPSVYFAAVDETVFPRVAKRFFDVELLPGTHVVRFGFDAADAYAVEEATGQFNAEAGRTYEARALFERFNVLPGRGTWQGVIVDLNTEAVVSVEMPKVVIDRSP